MHAFFRYSPIHTLKLFYNSFTDLDVGVLTLQIHHCSFVAKVHSTISELNFVWSAWNIGVLCWCRVLILETFHEDPPYFHQDLNSLIISLSNHQSLSLKDHISIPCCHGSNKSNLFNCSMLRQHRTNFPNWHSISWKGGFTSPTN